MLVARYGVILEIPPHHRLQPLQGVLDGLVHALLQLRLDFFQLGGHALADGLSLDHEMARPLARPAYVGETQKVEASPVFLCHVPSGARRRSARTRSGASSPGVAPARTSPAVPATAPGTARLLFGAGTPAQRRPHSGR